MAAENKLELVVEVDVNKANASIKSVNTGLSSMEQAAGKAARGASAGIDSMTASMAKGALAGNLLAGAFTSALSSAKEWIVQSVLLAAHEARAETAGLALAKAHGIAAHAFLESVEAVRKVGYHGDEAVHTINRLIIADIALSKGVGLAKLAKDAAAIENIPAAEAMEKIVLAIESGKARGLRSMGIFLNLEKEVTREELKLNRTLNEGERQMVAYNAVMREGAKIAGVHAATSGEAETMMKGLNRAVHELREAAGKQFQDDFKKFLGTLKDLAGWAKDNVSVFGPIAEAIKDIALVIVAYKLPSLIMGVVHALNAFRLAALGAAVANPFGLLAAGAVSFGLILWNEKKKLDQMNDSLGEMIKKRQILDAIRQGKSVAELAVMGITADDIRAAIAGKRVIAGEAPWTADESLPTGKPDPGALDDALKLARETRRKQMDAVRSSPAGTRSYVR